jgi:membrane-associated protein
MPILRTFAPVVAGAAQMGYPRFAAFNVIGGSCGLSMASSASRSVRRPTSTGTSTS